MAQSDPSEDPIVEEAPVFFQRPDGQELHIYQYPARLIGSLCPDPQSIVYYPHSQTLSCSVPFNSQHFDSTSEFAHGQMVLQGGALPLFRSNSFCVMVRGADGDYILIPVAEFYQLQPNVDYVENQQELEPYMKLNDEVFPIQTNNPRDQVNYTFVSAPIGLQELLAQRRSGEVVPDMPLSSYRNYFLHNTRLTLPSRQRAPLRQQVESLFKLHNLLRFSQVVQALGLRDQQLGELLQILHDIAIPFCGCFLLKYKYVCGERLGQLRDFVVFWFDGFIVLDGDRYANALLAGQTPQFQLRGFDRRLFAKLAPRYWPRDLSYVFQKDDIADWDEAAQAWMCQVEPDRQFLEDHPNAYDAALPGLRDAVQECLDYVLAPVSSVERERLAGAGSRVQVVRE